MAAARVASVTGLSDPVAKGATVRGIKAAERSLYFCEHHKLPSIFQARYHSYLSNVQ